MNSDQWQQLIKAIEQRECILLLGPGISTMQKGGEEIPLTTGFSHELASVLKENNTAYESDKINDLSYTAERYLTIPNATETDPAYLANKFFKKHTRLTDMHHFLAKLPFSLIINVAPDRLIADAYKEAGKDFIFGFYNFRKNTEKDIPEPQNGETIIYNIFGSIEDDYKSVIVSERDYIKFTSKVVERKPRVPTIITSQFEDPKFYLLVGFDYEQWHLKLLFHIFKVRNYPHHAVYTPQTAAFPISTPNRQFFADALNFKFVDKGISEFTTKLKNLYEESYGKNGEPEPPEKPLQVAIIAADEDRDLKRELLKYIGIMEQNAYITIWHSDQILASSNTNKVIREQLQKADIILPLVSADLFTSDALFEQLRIAFERHQNETAKVIPIVLRPCMWQDTPLAKMLFILPEQGKKPVKSWFWNSAEDAYKNIAENFKQFVFDQILNL
ncbi:MAG: SIR2 family protein [Chitinophagales bacterium]